MIFLLALALIYNHLLPVLPAVAAMIALSVIGVWGLQQIADNRPDPLLLPLLAVLVWSFLVTVLRSVLTGSLSPAPATELLWLLVAFAVYAGVRLAFLYEFCTVAQLGDGFALAVAVACLEVIARFVLHAFGADQFWLTHPAHGARPLARAGDWMTISGLILLALPHVLFLALARRPWAHGWLVLAALALVLGGSRAGLLAVWVVVIGLVLVRRMDLPRSAFELVALYAVGTLALGVLAAPLTLGDRGVGAAALVADSGRIAMWRDAWSTLQRAPLGLGLGGYTFRAPLPFAPWWYVTSHPHNQLLSILVWLGWPGLALSLWAAVVWLRAAWSPLVLPSRFLLAILLAWGVYLSVGTALWSVLASGAGALAIAVHSGVLVQEYHKRSLGYGSRTGDQAA